MKRALDFIFAVIALAVLAPAFALIAVATKLGDRGPVFFSQTRVGKFGRLFRMHKFRTMIPQAERQGLPLTVSGDERITRVGNWLRRTKLDELPQFWNVLKGDMSLVGPRPEVPRYVAFYTLQQRQVLAVRPGITDPASLQFFDEANLLTQWGTPEDAYIKLVMPRKLAINVNYLRRRTIASDVFVVMATLWRIVTSVKPRRAATLDVNRQQSQTNECNAI
jgi:lipopolysaccharide/colanic/teichoic acid biosynthesis glycosyltransferase